MRQALSVHSKNALVLAGFLLGAAPFGWRAVMSTAVGGGIQIVNLRGLERSVAAMLGLAELGRSGGIRLLTSVRWMPLLAVVAVALLVLPLEPIAFVVGLSSVVPAVIWHGFDTARRGGEG